MDSTGKGRVWLLGGLVALAYFATSQLGLEFAQVGHTVTLFWPPSGIALAALLIFGWRVFPAIAIGEFFANLGGGLPVTSILGLSCGNVLEGLLGYYLLHQRFGFDVHLKTLRDVRLLFVFGAIISPLAAAINGAWWIKLATGASWNEYLHTVQYWWMGDALGIALFTTAILAWRYGEPMQWTREYAQRALAGAVILLVACMILILDLPNRLLEFGLFLPLLIWIALNFNLRYVSSALLLIFLSSMLGLLLLGELRGTLADSLVNFVWLYNLLFGITSLSVAALNAQRRQEGAALRLAARVFESSGEAILITDAKAKVVAVNHAFVAMSGFSSDDIVGKDPSILKSGRHDAEFYRVMWESLKNHGYWQGEIWDKHKSGRIYPKWMSVTAVRDKQGKVANYISIARDTTEQTEAERNIHYLAYYDVLTGLPNRTLLRDRLGQLVAVSHRDQQQFALLFMDLDRFKYINDSMGHSVGDRLLQSVASRIQDCIREGDTVARIGGDEFIVLLRESDEKAAAVVAEKLLAALIVPYDLDGQIISTQASIGISVYPDHAQDVDTLIKNADMAMYRAKEEGRNNYQFFRAEMNFHVDLLFSMEKDLRLALVRNEFTLHYQPQVDLATGRLCGAEALIRWQHPEKGAISPGEFIKVAEETGQIIAIGEWVLRTACEQMVEWREAGLVDITIAVNLSMRQLRQPMLVDLVKTVLEESGLEPQYLELEITEGIMMGDNQIAMRFLNEMHALGVHLSIDDFGTGFSSLNYLKKLPVDKLKIDQSFVRDIQTDESDAAIIRSIISLGHRLNLRVIAEGVETQEQLDFLRIRGCDEMQGYFYARPMPAEAFTAFVNSRPRLA